MITVTVYTTGHRCQRCVWTCRRLSERGIPATVIDITLAVHGPARAFLTEELGYTEAPVVIVDGEPEHHWAGFRPDLIDRLAASLTNR